MPSWAHSLIQLLCLAALTAGVYGLAGLWWGLAVVGGGGLCASVLGELAAPRRTRAGA